jgi:hypothetical protein
MPSKNDKHTTHLLFMCATFLIKKYMHLPYEIAVKLVQKGQSKHVLPKCTTMMEG